MRHLTLITILLCIIGCGQKPNNLETFLAQKQLSFKTDLIGDSRAMMPTHDFLLGEGFTFAFWLQSRNNSKNGVVFTLHEKGSSDLKNSVVTLLVSKERLSLFSGRKDYRKIENKFENDVSQAFLNLPSLNANEKYFVTCTYRAKTRTITIEADGNLYLKQILEADTTNDLITVRLGHIKDHLVKKYFFKGSIDHFYLFNEILEKEERDLLMSLTLTGNYPISQ